MSSRKTRRKLSGGLKRPIVVELSVDDPIIAFSKEIKDQLIDKIKEKYNKIGWFRKQVVAKSPGWFTSKSKYIVNEKLPHIIKLISQKLNDQGLDVQPLRDSDIYVEIEYANAEAKPIKNDFIIHKDNHSVIDCNVHTFMVFLDMDCQGGELAFYSPKKEFIESLDSTSKNDDTKKVVMYNGGWYNNPLPITHGKRVVVMYYLRQHT